MSFWKHCGNELPEGAKFCSKCGTPVFQTEKPGILNTDDIQGPKASACETNTEKPFSQKRKRLSTGEKAVLCVSLIVLSIAAVIIVFMLTNKEDLQAFSIRHSEKAKAAATAASSADAEDDAAAEASSGAKSGRLDEVSADSENDDVSSEEGKSSAAFSGNINVGDIITFGSYEQDNDFSNSEEAIEWLVLSKESGKMLVISRYALDWMPYNVTDDEVTWETCSLRQWLNEDFLNAAFTSEEREQILTTKVTAEKNPEYDLDPGKDTKDQVFLLSYKEADAYFDSDEARQCPATKYVWANVDKSYSWARTDYDTPGENFSCLWWLRTPGEFYTNAAVITTWGIPGTRGYVVYSDTHDIAVRPALWIRL